MTSRLILGSQSPQRRRLLESIAGTNNVTVMPPLSDDEPGFADLKTTEEIEERLQRIVQLKTEDVCRQLLSPDGSGVETAICDDTVICADTVVVCTDPADTQVVLGKPPLTEWQDTVRQWFQQYYSNRTHEVWTGFQISINGQSEFQIVKAEVEFPAISEEWIAWYLSTEEPIGKAGGYGIQGHAAAFVRSIRGSLTTIIGLPVWELRESLAKAGCL